MAQIIGYQPVPKKGQDFPMDIYAIEYPSFVVWADKNECKRLFPTYSLATIRDGDVENPEVVE